MLIKSYDDANQTAQANVCTACGSELLVIPIHPENNRYALICSTCKFRLRRWRPAADRVHVSPWPSVQKSRLFWSHVHIPCSPNGEPNLDLCWNWTGGVDGEKGYGYFRGEEGTQRSNRYAYRLTHPMSRNIDRNVIRHSCDNRSCCNACHLIRGDYRANTLDIYWRNRAYWLKMDVARVVQLFDDAKRGATTKQLVQKYGIQEWMVRNIVRGISWSWVTGLPRAYHQKRPNRSESGLAAQSDAQ